MLIALLIAAASGVAARRPKQGRVYLSSLDDRAYLRYGVLFDALNAEQQQEILARYRVGTYLWTPPEQQVQDLHGTRRADVWRIRLCAIAAFAVLCSLLHWAELQGHARFITESWLPVLIAGSLAAWVLPDMQRKWSEPDAPPIRDHGLPNSA